MIETLVRFGDDARLRGILTVAEPAAANGHGTAVVFITAGLLHKPGPYRLYTDLARMLAREGFPSLRFDLSGIGESGPRTGVDNAERANVTDVRAAIDVLAAGTGCTRFVTAGLCSGAEVAHRTALTDARVAGVIALDGYIVRTPAFYFWHYLPRLLSARKWAGFLAARFRKARNAWRNRSLPAQRDAEHDGLAFWGGPGPDRETLVREFDALCRRGVWQLQVFSGGSGDCSYAHQFRDAFGAADFRGLIDVRFNADSDHMYILNSDRRALMRSITQWLQERFAHDPLRAAARALHAAESAVALQFPNNEQGTATLAARRNIE